MTRKVQTGGQRPIQQAYSLMRSMSKDDTIWRDVFCALMYLCYVRENVSCGERPKAHITENVFSRKKILRHLRTSHEHQMVIQGK